MVNKYQRIQFIDFLKAICIIAVICIHTVNFSFSEKDITITALYVDNICRFAVPLFFGVLGYMTIKKYTHVVNWRLFYKRKVVYLVVPYFLWSICYYFIPTVYPFDNKNEGKEYWWQILNGESEVHLYFMVAYFLFLVITPLIVTLYKFIPKNMFIKLCIIGIILHLLLLTYSDYITWSMHDDFWYTKLNYSLPIHWFGYYLTGYVLAIDNAYIIMLINRAQKRIGSLNNFSKCLVLYLIMVGVFLVTLRGLKAYATLHLYWISIVALILIWGAYCYVQRTRVLNFFIFIGQNTFAIYLSHVLFLKIIYICLGKSSFPLNLIITFALGFVLSLMYVPIHHKLYNKRLF